MNLEKVSINELTLQALPLRLMNGDSHGAGTGFLYRVGDQVYLITAWHNLSGRNFVTKRPITRTGWLPTRCGLSFCLWSVEGEGKQFGKFEFEFDLYPRHLNGAPIWTTDPIARSKNDIAAVSLCKLLDHDCIENQVDRAQLEEIVNKIANARTPVMTSLLDKPLILSVIEKRRFLNRLSVAQDVFAIGYPQSMHSSVKLAIWKRGTVASEPDLDLNGRPAFLIDAATRPGMSGAPVFANFEDPSWDHKGGRLTKIGREFGFVGLYSARLSAPADEAQLGFVWKEDAIEKVACGGSLGTSSFDVAALNSEAKDVALL